MKTLLLIAAFAVTAAAQSRTDTVTYPDGSQTTVKTFCTAYGCTSSVSTLSADELRRSNEARAREKNCENVRKKFGKNLEKYPVDLEANIVQCIKTDAYRSWAYAVLDITHKPVPMAKYLEHIQQK